MLSDQEVKERTDVTMKMANVTGESAKQVSSYMTAIWNNFDDGSQTMESFADKITALGAATASSSEEIATGLQQFASLGSTLGLSYDDATAALATVVAQTRQSASVVGNSFRTLLQRMTSLAQGETLEDGVDLTKYSEALKKVGVNILDDTGELRDMHDIIMDIGSAWQSLSDTQKVALAQTVGGVRNSNTFTALFDNFDIFKNNLEIAEKSQGTLEKQQEIYAESWEAAGKRVKAAWESIYDELIDDKFFTKFADTLTTIIHLVDSLIKSMGGLKGVLAGTGAIIAKVYGKDIVENVSNAFYGIKSLIGKNQKDASTLSQQASDLANDALKELGGSAASATEQTMVETSTEQLVALNKYRDIQDKISTSDKDRLQVMLSVLDTMHKQTSELAKQYDEVKKNGAFSRDNFNNLIKKSGKDQGKKWNAINASVVNGNEELNRQVNAWRDSQKAVKQLKGLNINSNEDLKDTQGLLDSIEDSLKAIDKVNLDRKFSFSNKDLAEAAKLIKEIQKNINEKNAKAAKENGAKLGNLLSKQDDNIRDARSEYYDSQRGRLYHEIQGDKNTGPDINSADLDRIAADRIERLEAEKEAEDNFNASKDNSKEYLNSGIGKFIEDVNKKGPDVASKLSNFAEGIGNIAMASASLGNVMETISDLMSGKIEPSASNIVSIFTSMGIAIPTLINGVESLMEVTQLGLAQVSLITAGISAAMILVPKIISWVKEQSPEGQLKKANEELQQQQDNLTELKNKYEELNNAISQLKSAEDTLNGLTKGSIEWKKALYDINQQVLLLIQAYPELAKYVSNDNGQLKISDEGFNTLLENQLKKVNAQQMATLTASNTVMEKQNDVTKQDTYDALKKKWSGTNLSVFQGNDLFDKIANNPELLNSQQNLINAIKEVAPNMANATDWLETNSKVLMDNKTTILANTSAVNNNTAAQDINKQQTAQDYLDNNLSGKQKDVYENSDYKDTLTSIFQEKAESYKGENSNKVIGYDDETLKSTIQSLGNYDKVTGNSKNGFELDGQSFSAGEVRDMIVQIQSLQQAIKDTDFSKINKQLQDIGLNASNAGEGFDKILAGIKSGKISGVTEGQLDQFSDYLKGLDPDKLKTLAKMYGYDTGKEFMDAFKNGEKDADTISEDEFQAQKDAAIKQNDMNDVIARASEHYQKLGQSEEDATKAAKDYSEEVSEYADYLKDVLKDQGLSQEQIDDIAEANSNLNRGIKDLIDNYDDYIDVIKYANKEGNEALKDSSDYSKAIRSLQGDLEDIVGVDTSQLSENFLTNANTLDLLREAAYGSADAVDQLRISAAQDIITNAKLNTEGFDSEYNNLIQAIDDVKFNDIKIGATLDGQTFFSALDEMIQKGAFTAEQVNSLLGTIGYQPVVTTQRVELNAKQAAKAHNHGTINVDGQTVSINEADIQTDSEGHEYVDVPVINPGFPGAGSVAMGYNKTKGVSGAQLLAKAAAASRFTGGTGKNISPSNHNAGNKARSGGGKKGGGGGPGSKSKKKTVEKMQDHEEAAKWKKETDRYHNIKEVVDDLDDQLDLLNKNADRAYGAHRIAQMDNVIKKIKQQTNATKEYVKQIQNYSKEDRSALEQTLRSIGMTEKEVSQQFTSEGLIKDYEGILDKLQQHFADTARATYLSAVNTYNQAIDRYNAAVAAYNASDQGDAAKDTFDNAKNALDASKETFDKAKDAYSKAQDQLKDQEDTLKKYEDTMNALQEQQEKLREEYNDLFDKALEIVKTKYELKLDINEQDLKSIEWMYDNLGDQTDKVIDRMANLGKQATSISRDISTNTNAIRDALTSLPEAFRGTGIDFNNLILNPTNAQQMISVVDEVVRKLESVGGEADIQTLMDNLTDYENNLMDNYSDLQDVNKNITDNMKDAFEDWTDQLDKNLDNNDHLETILESYKDIADLLGQEQMGISDEDMRSWRKARLEIQRDAAEIAQANYQSAESARQEALQKYQDALNSGDEFAIERFKEMYDSANEYSQSAQEEFLDRWKETLSSAQDDFEDMLDQNEKAYNRSLGASQPTLDYLADQLDRQEKLDDLYLDDYEKYKRLGDLQININQQLAKNPNVKTQEKLNTLMDDVNAKMADGVQISDGEATILEKRLALLQAEDQLLAARNAKSAVRMTRDNEGNFSYTYTADTSQVEQAQASTSQAFYDLLDQERNYSQQTQDAILQSYQDFISKRNDIIQDDSLTESEREALLAQLEKDCDATVGFYVDEMDMVTSEMGRLKTDDWKDLENVLDRVLAADDDFQTTYNQTTLGQLTPAWNNATDALKAFEAAADQLVSSDLQTYKDWIQWNEESNARLGTSTESVGAQLADNYSKLIQSSSDAKKSSEDMAQQMQTDFDALIAKGQEFGNNFDTYMTQAKTAIENVTAAVDELREHLANINDVTIDTKISSPSLGNENVYGFASGGYTGDWNSKGGKLAFLHQKELVLNKNDTSNILSAVGLVRDMIAPSIVSGLKNSISYAGLAGIDQGELRQHVQIEANFPNVKSHTEIEEAFNNLINSASQYVNRK